MKRLGLVVVTAAALCSCGEMTAAEQARMDALVACAKKARAVFPQLDEVPENETLKVGETSEDDVRVGPDGHFVFSAANVAPKRISSFAFVCSGSLRAHRIDGIEVAGTMKHPSVGEIWSF